jgi:hypothetical protein
LNRSKEEVLAWEKRWSLPVAIATLVGVAALIGSAAAASSISGDGNAEVLRSVHEHSSSETLSGIIQAVGFALFAAPLFYLFRAVRARSGKVRSQLVGLVVVAPLFLAASVLIGAAAKNEGAKEFVAGQAKSTLSAPKAKEECTSKQKEEGAKEFSEEYEPGSGETALAACEKRKVEDNEASNAVSEASLSPAAAGLGIAGGLGIAVAFFYSCLWAMRTGLLGRFWASFGMAVGVAALIGFILLPMIWFVYFALLIGGWIPGGRPPAWAAGEAVPWPTPGQQAAEKMEPEEPGANPELEISDTQTDGSSKPRKRKQRD